MSRLRSKLDRLHHRTTLADLAADRPAPVPPAAGEASPPMAPAPSAPSARPIPRPPRTAGAPSPAPPAPPAPSAPFPPPQERTGLPPLRSTAAGTAPRNPDGGTPVGPRSTGDDGGRSGRGTRGRTVHGEGQRGAMRDLTERAFAAWKASRGAHPPLHLVLDTPEPHAASTPPTPAPTPAPDATAAAPSPGLPIEEHLRARRVAGAHLSELTRGRFHAGALGQCFSVEDAIPLSTRIGDACLREALDHPDRVGPLAERLDLVPFLPRRALFLDLETTGLRAVEGDLAFVIGLAAIRGDAVEFELIIAHDPSEEAAALQRLLVRLARADSIVTFNGARFDLPFLQVRMRRLALDTRLLELPHVDLYRASRRWVTGLPNRRQVTHEEHLLGFARAGDLPGSEAPQRFARAQRTGDASHLLDVLDHNRLDLAAMLPLLGRMAGRVPASIPADDAMAHLRHAATQAAEGRDDEALESMRRARAAGIPAGEARRAAWEQARLEELAGHTAEAMRVLLPFSEDDPRVQLRLSALCEQLHLLSRALFHAERARTLAPWSGEPVRRVNELRARGAR